MSRAVLDALGKCTRVASLSEEYESISDESSLALRHLASNTCAGPKPRHVCDLDVLTMIVEM